MDDSSQKKPKEDNYKIGLELKERGDSGAAMARFDWARHEDWNNADAHGEWGILTRRSLEFYNDNPDQVPNPASLRMLMGSYDKAEEAFQFASV